MAVKKQVKPGVTKVSGEIKESGIVIQNINIRPVQRSKTDIQDWRNKHQNAEAINGSREALYDLYDDALLDAFLNRLVRKRVLGVTKNKLMYVGEDDKKEIKGTSCLIDSLQFIYLRECIQLQKAWGITVMELMNVDDKLYVFDVPKKHIKPREKLIIQNQFDIEGIRYDMPPYNRTVVEIGRHDDLGYLLQATCYAIYKRGNIADWANYAQIFGMPFREARYDGFNEQVRIQLEQALEKAASAAWAVLPKDAEFTMHKDSSGSNSNDLYNTLRQAMNEEMMVLILGATESTTSSKSSGYAQSETHFKTVNEVAQDDKIKEIAILNEVILPVLINIGLLPPGGKFVNEDPVDLDTAKTKISIAQQVKLMGLPVDADDIYEISGLKKPDDFDAQVQKMEDEKAKQQQQADGKKEDKKLSLEAEIKNVLTDFFGSAH